jgi:hypothetical protein
LQLQCSTSSGAYPRQQSSFWKRSTHRPYQLPAALLLLLLHLALLLLLAAPHPLVLALLPVLPLVARVAAAISWVLWC